MSIPVTCTNPCCRPASATRGVPFAIVGQPVLIPMSAVAAAGRMDPDFHLARATACPWCGELTLQLVEEPPRPRPGKRLGGRRT